MPDVLLTDTECYPDLWCAGFKRATDGKVLVLKKTADHELDRDRLRRLMMRNTIVTYNGMGYDRAMIWGAIEGLSLAELKQLNDRIILGRTRWWEVSDLVGEFVRSWEGFPRMDLIDLMEPQPNAVASLKTLNGRLHGKTMRDLPYSPDSRLTPEQIDEVVSYMKNDLDATHLLYDALKEPLEIREEIGKDIGQDLRSKSDTQLGFAILKRRVEERTKGKIGKPIPMAGKTFRYDVPPFIQFHTPRLQELLERIRDHDFRVKADGKVDLPKFLADERIMMGDATYKMGIGGLHSTESARSVWESDTHAIVDVDVGSFYPATILLLGLYPPAMGPATLPAYGGIREERMAAKAAKRRTRADGFKTSLNGFFGLTSNIWSPAYSPPMTMSITLTGQLAILMLIERAEHAGFKALSANTDGVTFLCPREKTNKIVKDRMVNFEEGSDIPFSLTLKEITDHWEKDTGYDLEFVRYTSIHNANVNTYFAIKEDGSVKRKGRLMNTRKETMRDQLMHNPGADICADAVVEWLLHGTPIEDTIRGATDMRDFVTVVNVKGGGKWRGEYLGKVVRYYWGVGGEPILYCDPHPSTGNHKKVSKSDGAIPCMEMPDQIPGDLDYDRYIAEAREIVSDIGMAVPGHTVSFADLFNLLVIM